MSQNCSRPMAILSYVILMVLLGLVEGQNYHYSNGWYPGKRSGPSTLNIFRSSSKDMCSFQPQVLSYINDLLQEELSRIQQTCVPLALKELLEPLQEQMESRRKVTDTEENLKR